MKARHLVQAIFFLIVVGPFMALFIGVRVRGREYLPRRGPFVIVANHSSHMDTLSLMNLFPLQQLSRLRPVGAADYFDRNRTVAWFSRTLFNVLLIERRHVNRVSNPVDAMAQALRRGESLIVFPEGTRGPDGAMAGFKPGIAHLIEACPEVPVVPVHLVNMGRSLPKGEVLPVPFVCEIRIGGPLSVSGPRAEVVHQVEEAVRRLGPAHG
jgi:1-acyl-sn-glycerol-3-phosphate acyltransferase